MGTNISKLSNGLYEVKPQGEPARCFYTQAQAQKFLENFNSSNLQPLANDTVQITQRKKHTWTNYAQEHGTTYTKPPKSGVVIADERAAQIIAQNAEKAAQQPVIQQPIAQPAAAKQQYINSITSQPTAFNMQPTAAQQQYVRSTTSQPTAAKQPIVQQPTAQPTASLQPQTNNTAQITPRKKHTWANYAQEHGTTYTTPPKSGVVIAD